MTYETCKVLSPAGSMDVLKPAVFSGADFIYLSGTKYGARDYAENFNYDEIKEAIKHHSCKYAKKQYTYIRDIPGSTRIDFSASESDFNKIKEIINTWIASLRSQ